jgi:hypothetical protein
VRYAEIELNKRPGRTLSTFELSLDYVQGELFLERFGDTRTSLGGGGLRPRRACLGVKGLETPCITKSVKFDILKHLTGFKSYPMGYQFFTPLPKPC